MTNMLLSILLTIFISSSCYAVSGDKIFYEDFSSYTDGELPVGWIGGENLGVSQINQKKVLKYLVNNSYDVTTKKIDLSRNFKATILMKHYFHNQRNSYKAPETYHHDKYIKERSNGSIVIYFGTYQIWISDGIILAGIKDKWPNWEAQEAVLPEKLFSLTLKKRGAACILYVNNDKVFVQRFPDVKMNNIRFASKSKFEIHSIVVEEL